METIIASLITGAVAIIVSLLTNKSQHEKTVALIDYRLQELEKKVDKHNNLVERTYKLEQDSAVQNEQIKVANHRIDDLERK